MTGKACTKHDPPRPAPRRLGMTVVPVTLAEARRFVATKRYAQTIGEPAGVFVRVREAA